jgi:hypothetical protein
VRDPADVAGEMLALIERTHVAPPIESVRDTDGSRESGTMPIDEAPDSGHADAVATQSATSRAVSSQCAAGSWPRRVPSPRGSPARAPVADFHQPSLGVVRRGVECQPSPASGNEVSHPPAILAEGERFDTGIPSPRSSRVIV